MCTLLMEIPLTVLLPIGVPYDLIKLRMTTCESARTCLIVHLSIPSEFHSISWKLFQKWEGVVRDMLVSYGTTCCTGHMKY